MTDLKTQQPQLVRAMGFWMLTAYGAASIWLIRGNAAADEIAAVTTTPQLPPH